MLIFSIIMWFCSAVTIILAVTLLRGNYASMHGKVFDGTEDKEGYAKAMGGPALFLGCGMLVVGILASSLKGLYSIIISAAFLLLTVIAVGLWFSKIQKKYSVKADL